VSVSVSVSTELDHDAIAELAASPDVLAALYPVAESIADIAAGYAPRRIAPTIGILGEGTGDSGGACVYVGSADPFAHLWEFGSVNTPTVAFMRNAAVTVADRWEGS
jgi:hypothetical protein